VRSIRRLRGINFVPLHGKMKQVSEEHSQAQAPCRNHALLLPLWPTAPALLLSWPYLSFHASLVLMRFCKQQHSTVQYSTVQRKEGEKEAGKGEGDWAGGREGTVLYCTVQYKQGSPADGAPLNIALVTPLTVFSSLTLRGMLPSSCVQSKRDANLEKFRKAPAGVLVCTDVAARGLDFPDINAILQVHHHPTPLSGPDSPLSSACFRLACQVPCHPAGAPRPHTPSWAGLSSSSLVPELTCHMPCLHGTPLY